jgi:Flp pilus assembly protein TadD/4-amino-4-deoxy-L-arabinose transferase-like glycosyltransferase
MGDGRMNGNFLVSFLKRRWKILLFFFVLILAVYGNSLNNEFVSDDIIGIQKNDKINTFSYVFLPPYSYLRQFLVFLIHKFFGLQPIFYRLPNVFFHFGSTVLVFLLLRRFFKKPIPFLTATIFAVHPLLAESITWISGGQYVFMAFFLLLSFLYYLKASKEKNKNNFLLWSLLFFILAILSSEKSVFYPGVLFFFEIFFGSLKKNFRRLISFFVIDILWLFWLFRLLGEKVTDLQTNFYQTPQMVNPFIQIPIAVTYYLKLIFWPQDLTLYHSELSFTQGEFILRVLLLAVFLGVIVFFWKKEKKVSFFLLFFLMALSPTLLPLNVGWVVAERYAYLASLGIFVFMAFIIQKIGRLFKNKKVVYILLAIIVLALSLRTIVRNNDWQNQDTLWLSAQRTSPSSHQNHNNLGDLYARRGDYPQAIEEFKKAIELKPDYGDAYHNMANVNHQMGQDDLAEQNYKKALSLNPRLWQSYQNLAAIYFSQKNLDLAQESMNKAIEINPNQPDLYSNLGAIYVILGDKQKAQESFQKALLLNPNDQRARQSLDKLNP